MRSSADSPSRTKKKIIESIIDQPLIKKFKVDKVNKKMVSAFPQPLKSTLYILPKPVPKPRTIQPIPLPRTRVPKQVAEKVNKMQKLIDEIAPYYEPSAISEFKKI